MSKHNSSSSSVSAAQALAALQSVGYRMLDADPGRSIRPTEKTYAARLPGAELSRTGKSVRMVFEGAAGEGRAREVFVPVKGMLTVGAAAALERQARVKFPDFSR